MSEEERMKTKDAGSKLEEQRRRLSDNRNFIYLSSADHHHRTATGTLYRKSGWRLGGVIGGYHMASGLCAKTGW